jgi:hypothetical protein
MISVRISQMNDDFKFSKENQSFLAVASAPALFLNGKLNRFVHKKRPREHGKAKPACHKHVHGVHNFSPL